MSEVQEPKKSKNQPENSLNNFFVVVFRVTQATGGHSRSAVVATLVYGQIKQDSPWTVLFSMVYTELGYLPKKRVFWQCFILG